MDKVLKVKDFVIGIVTFILALLTLGYNVGSWQGRTVQDINDLKVRVGAVESDNRRLDNENKKLKEFIYEAMEPMRKDVVDIKIMLQNKKDRE